MTGPPNGPWWHVLPALETWVPCGPDLHPVRWEDGRLSLPAHPDAEGELVFAALSGEKAGCVEVAEAWHRHADDLGVLALGPRGPSDEVNISWDDVQDFRSGQASKFGRRFAMGGGRGVVGSRPMRPGPPLPGRSGPPRLPSGRPGMIRPGEEERVRAARLDMLILLALGPPFQLLLSGLVAAAWSDGGARAEMRPRHRPALEAALTGRLAAVAAAWLGIGPDRVDARLQEGTGWGSLELTGTGEERQLRARLPAGWLATVWAGGLAVVDGHLVVAVQRAAWPEATVLAVPEPGGRPAILDVRAGEAASTPGDRAHWVVTDRRAPVAGPRPAGPSGGEADRP